MRRISKTHALVALSALAMAVACTDEIPTLPDPDLFPGALPTTIEYVVGGSALLRSAVVITGGSTVDDVLFKLVAQDFDGVLKSHLLAQFHEFPKAAFIGVAVDSTFTYEDSWVIATLPDTLRVSNSQLEFQLWTVTQPFDSIDVTWENAVDKPNVKTPWTVPGGTRGNLLSTAIWSKDATTADADSIKLALPAATITALANGTLPGLMVTMGVFGTRVEMSSLVIAAHLRPASADTVVTDTVTSQAQTFVYTPEPARPPTVLRAGGIDSERTLMKLSLENDLPACSGGSSSCADMRDPSSVSLNRVDLLLDPLPVANGFRPIAPLRVTLRRLLEPELGPRATLGEIVGEAIIPVIAFAQAGGEPVRFDLTNAVLNALGTGQTELDVAILVEPEASTPSFAWFARNPRLRFIYTLPQRPQLP